MVYGENLSTLNGQSAPLEVKMKIVTLQEITEKIQKKFPNEPFEIIEYTRVSKPFKIKCLKCGRISEYSNFNNYINAKRLGVCQCYNPKSNLELHNQLLEKVTKLLESLQDEVTFIRHWWKPDTLKHMTEVKCLRCGQIYSKTNSDFLKNPNCPYCVGKELLNTQAVKAILPQEYELLSEYKSTNEKVKIRHLTCGFIWETKVKKLYNYIGCPHCNKKKSKGEQKIIRFLLDKNLAFENEKSFNWQSNQLRRYDFYIPEFNLICEYNGEQHYKENNLFSLSLNQQQAIDKEKQEEAIKQGYNYLIIGYFDYDNIETILEKWFNDYPKGVDASASK